MFLRVVFFFCLANSGKYSSLHFNHFKTFRDFGLVKKKLKVESFISTQVVQCHTKPKNGDFLTADVYLLTSFYPSRVIFKAGSDN